MRGRIVGLNCGMYSVVANNLLYRVPAKGKFRTKGIKPVVGDYVDLDENYGAIKEVIARTSFLQRPTIANIDQIVIVQSMKEPEFSYQLIFKYITYANSNGIPTKIIITKIDKGDSGKMKEIKETFDILGIQVFFINNKTKEGLNEVVDLFANKTSCLMGQTGAGKSSTLNSIDPSFSREEGEYSKALGRGKHKTKEVALFPFNGGYIADTPGFSSLDLELYKEDLAIYFPGFNEDYQKCYFSNCLHVTESKCEIKKMVSENRIPQIAYDCYLKLLEEAIYKNRRFER